MERTTLIAGGPGCGKTVMAMEFLVNGILGKGEPGVFMAFEKDAESLMTNFTSMGHDLKELTDKHKLLIDHVDIGIIQGDETGDFTLDPLLLRLKHAI